MNTLLGFFNRVLHWTMSRTKPNLAPYPVVYIDSLDPQEMPTIYLDEDGRLFYNPKEIETTRVANYLEETNQQLYFQIVKSYKEGTQAMVVMLQASLVSKELNLKTVSKLMCSNTYCCNQLFVKYLYRSTIKFQLTPGKYEDKNMDILYHKHVNDGSVSIMFHGE